MFWFSSVMWASSEPGFLEVLVIFCNIFTCCFYSPVFRGFSEFYFIAPLSKIPQFLITLKQSKRRFSIVIWCNIRLLYLTVKTKLKTLISFTQAKCGKRPHSLIDLNITSSKKLMKTASIIYFQIKFAFGLALFYPVSHVWHFESEPGLARPGSGNLDVASVPAWGCPWLVYNLRFLVS